MSIAIYPEFRPLELNGLEAFVKAFKDNPPAISEFTFTNLYAWREAYKFSVSLLDNLLIVYSASGGRRRFFVPIGKGDIKTAMGKILNDTGEIFFRLPEETRVLFAGDKRFIIEPDRDNSDYLYNTADLVSLSGGKYDGKRNLIKKFKSEHAYEYIRLDQVNVRLCLDFEEAWCSIKNCDRVEGLSNERRAIKDMVDNFSGFGLIGGAIKVKDAICAVSLAQELNPATLVLHVLKADPNMTGLYQVMMQEFLAREAGRFQYVNLEQDLGLDGLRKSKLSYHPCAMVDKYTLRHAE
jgi:uncharacterized protein